MVLKKILESSMDRKWSSQSLLKDISPEYSLERLMLKLELKLQYFDYLMGRPNSLEKTLTLGKIEGRRPHKPSGSLLSWHRPLSDCCRAHGSGGLT